MSRLIALGRGLGGSVGAGSRVTIDASEIDELRSLLGAAANAAPGAADEALDIIVPQVYREAMTTVAGYPMATGETAASMGFDTRGFGRRIWAGTKQGALLEYGTPTTGGPRPWLTGPAERGSMELLRHMAKIGEETL